MLITSLNFSTCLFSWYGLLIMVGGDFSQTLKWPVLWSWSCHWSSWRHSYWLAWALTSFSHTNGYGHNNHNHCWRSAMLLTVVANEDRKKTESV